MAIVWPVTIPQKPQRQGLDIDPDDNNLRSPMDTGEPKIRQISSLQVDRYAWIIRLNSSTKVGYLNAFYNTTTSNGTAAFEWDDPLTGTTYNWKFAERPKLHRHLGGDCWEYRVVLDRLSAA